MRSEAWSRTDLACSSTSSRPAVRPQPRPKPQPMPACHIPLRSLLWRDFARLPSRDSGLTDGRAAQVPSQPRARGMRRGHPAAPWAPLAGCTRCGKSDHRPPHRACPHDPRGPRRISARRHGSKRRRRRRIKLRMVPRHWARSCLQPERPLGIPRQQAGRGAFRAVVPGLRLRACKGRRPRTR